MLATFIKTGGSREDADEIRPVMIVLFTIFEPIRYVHGIGLFSQGSRLITLRLGLGVQGSGFRA